MDASPQWWGRELFVATFDLVVIESGVRRYSRHLMPLINIGSRYRTVKGKVFGFLWMLTLMVGPHFGRLQQVLSRVRSITSGMGGEFLVRGRGRLP